MRPKDAKLISPTGCSEVAPRTSRRGRHLKLGEVSIGDQRRAEILAFAEGYIRENGYAPTLREICKALFIEQATLKYHMSKLRNAGYIIGPGDGMHAWTLPKFAAACRAVE